VDNNTGQMAFLSHRQQLQSTDGITATQSPDSNQANAPTGLVLSIHQRINYIFR